MNKEIQNSLVETLNEWLLDQENPKLNLKLAEQYRALNQPAAAFAHYLKLYEMLPESEVELRYHCIMSICEIYWHTGNRLKAVIHHARLAKAEQPDRPEAYFMIANAYRDMCIRNKQEHHYDWIQVYENAKIGILYAESGHDRVKSKYYIGVNYLRYLFILACIKCGKLMEAKKYIGDIDIKDLEPWAVSRVITLYRELAIPCPYLLYNSETEELDGFGEVSIEENYAPNFEDLFVLRCTDCKREGKFMDFSVTGHKEDNATYLLEDKFGWTGETFSTNEPMIYHYNAERKSLGIHTDPMKFNYCNWYKIERDTHLEYDYLNINLGNYDLNVNLLYNLPLDNIDYRIITIKDYEDYGHKDDALRLAQFMLNKGYVMVAHVKDDLANHALAWYLNTKYYSGDELKYFMNIFNKEDIKSCFIK